MKAVTNKTQLSKEIATPTTSLMGKMGGVKIKGKKALCKGLEDPCIKNGTVGKQLTAEIKK